MKILDQGLANVKTSEAHQGDAGDERGNSACGLGLRWRGVLSPHQAQDDGFGGHPVPLCGAVYGAWMAVSEDSLSASLDEVTAGIQGCFFNPNKICH